MEYDCKDRNIFCQETNKTVEIHSDGSVDISSKTFIPYNHICPHQGKCQFYIDAIKNKEYCPTVDLLHKEDISKLGPTH